jgi:hypothetical protein
VSPGSPGPDDYRQRIWEVVGVEPDTIDGPGATASAASAGVERSANAIASAVPSVTSLAYEQDVKPQGMIGLRPRAVDLEALDVGHEHSRTIS